MLMFDLGRCGRCEQTGYCVFYPAMRVGVWCARALDSATPILQRSNLSQSLVNGPAMGGGGRLVGELTVLGSRKVRCSVR
jgi:hypothetical protein